MRRSFLAVLAVALSFGLPVGRAQADFTVSVGSTTIAEGGTGYVDVTISSVGIAPLPLASVGFTANDGAHVVLM